MNSKHKPSLVRGLAANAMLAAKKYATAEQSPPVQEARQADLDFAKRIRAAIEKAKTVEDLIFIEQNLQKLDLLKAKNQEDKNSIVASQKKYDQFSMTIAEMRNNPDGYIRLCMANIKNINANPYKFIMENSLAFINGNVTRMRSRMAFSPDSERDMWEARIAVAGKTSEMFAALHNSLADGFEEQQGTAAR